MSETALEIKLKAALERCDQLAHEFERDRCRDLVEACRKIGAEGGSEFFIVGQRGNRLRFTSLESCLSLARGAVMMFGGKASIENAKRELLTRPPRNYGPSQPRPTDPSAPPPYPSEAAWQGHLRSGSPEDVAKAIQLMIGSLSSPNSLERRQAVLELEKQGEGAKAAFPALQKLIETETDPETIEHAQRLIKILGPISAPIPQPPQGEGALAGQDRTVPEILALVNRARAEGRKCGETYYPAAAPLAWSDLLADIAMTHSRDMAQHEHFEHEGTDGSRVWSRAMTSGYNFLDIGENIALHPDAESAMRGWLKSPGHCANIMKSKFLEIGVAYVLGYSAKVGSTVETGWKVPYWTMVLGSRK